MYWERAHDHEQQDARDDAAEHVERHHCRSGAARNTPHAMGAFERHPLYPCQGAEVLALRAIVHVRRVGSGNYGIVHLGWMGRKPIKIPLST